MRRIHPLLHCVMRSASYGTTNRYMSRAASTNAMTAQASFKFRHLAKLRDFLTLEIFIQNTSASEALHLLAIRRMRCEVEALEGYDG